MSQSLSEQGSFQRAIDALTRAKKLCRNPFQNRVRFRELSSENSVRSWKSQSLSEQGSFQRHFPRHYLE